MSVGDFLEALAAAALTAAAYLWSGIVLALAVGAVSLFYFGQVYAGSSVRRKKP